MDMFCFHCESYVISIFRSSRLGFSRQFLIFQVFFCFIFKLSGFPLGLENLGKWEGIFQSGKSQGILNRLEKSGKITQNTGKLR